MLDQSMPHPAPQLGTPHLGPINILLPWSEWRNKRAFISCSRNGSARSMNGYSEVVTYWSVQLPTDCADHMHRLSLLKMAIPWLCQYIREYAQEHSTRLQCCELPVKGPLLCPVYLVFVLSMSIHFPVDMFWGESSRTVAILRLLDLFMADMERRRLYGSTPYLL